MVTTKSERELKLEAALKRIAKWVGEFPQVDHFYDEEKTKRMSYAAAYGSNGERDYMRNVASKALDGD